MARPMAKPIAPIAISPVIPLLLDELNKLKMNPEHLDTFIQSIINPNNRVTIRAMASTNLQMKTLYDWYRIEELINDSWKLISENFKYYFDSTYGPKELIHELEVYRQITPYSCPRSIVTNGSAPVLGTLMFMLFSKYHKEIGMPSFLFANVIIGSTEDRGFVNQNIKLIYNTFLQSNIHFVLKKTFLPIMIQLEFTLEDEEDGNDCFHNVCCLYFPDYNPTTNILIWNRITIDSSAILFKDDICFKQIAMFSDMEMRALQLYTKALQHQMAISIQIHQIPCIQNIQKKLSTCDFWATWLCILFLHDWKYLVKKMRTDSTYVTQWCATLANTSSQHMHRFIDLFITMRLSIVEHLLYIARGFVRMEDKGPYAFHVENVSGDPFQIQFLKATMVGFSTQSGFEGRLDIKPRAINEEAERIIYRLLHNIKQMLASTTRDMNAILRLKSTPSPRHEESMDERKSQEPSQPSQPPKSKFYSSPRKRRHLDDH